MDFFSGIVEGFTSINWEAIAQLSMVGLIGLAGPAVVFVLVALRGNL
jgi:hypothetical protein